MFDLSSDSEDEHRSYLKLKAGTYNYFAPELFTNPSKFSFGPATDIWALGLTFYFLLTGLTPFSGAKSLFDLAKMVETEEIDFSKVHNEKARDCMRRMLDKNPHTRATMEELIKMDWVTNSGTEPL